MKYETRETHRMTDTGEEWVTESVPVYSKHEQRAMARKAARLAKHGEGENKPHVKLPFILRHPMLILLFVGLLVIFIVYMISSANTYMDELLVQYTSLTAKHKDSKSGFDKKLFYITVNSDGTKTVTVGYRSEEEEADAAEAVNNATTGDPNGTTTTPTGTKLTTNQAMDYIWNYFKGQGYCDEAIAGIMGNIMQESTFNPEAKSSLGYYGLCQWSASRQTNLRAQQPSDYNTVAGQCSFIMYETEHSAGPGSTRCTATNMNDPYTFFESKDADVTSSENKVEVCTFLFVKYFEGCIKYGETDTSYSNRANAYQEWKERLQYAQDIYTTYHQ
jgi:hypothetical protein